jgi:glycosyltransferase involved in cell wall biosynthesis
MFWLLAILSVYSYFLYPIILRLLPARADSTQIGDAGQWPSLSVIVTARNEANRIRDKVENLLELPPYPGALEIIVASDASTDGTDEIVRDFADRGVRLLRNPNHEGKEAAQAMAIRDAKGEILVFTDVATLMRGDVLERVAHQFADPRVGAISSTDQFVDREGNQTGEGAYVRYEMALRRMETRVHSVVGLSGSFFAARSEICRARWATNVPSDFMAAVNCARLGFVAAAADDVVGYYPDLKDSSKEYARKVRTVVRGMRALADTREILNPRRYGFFSLQVWSHKLMRWLTPWFLLALLLISVPLAARHTIYAALLGIQLLFYALALLGVLSKSAQSWTIIRIPYYFVLANIALMHAGIDFARGKSFVTWTPSER